MQDEKKNLPEHDELEDIKMLLGEENDTPENADALLDDILKEYQMDGISKNDDPNSLLAELENLTAQLSAEAGEPLPLDTIEEQGEAEKSAEIVEAEHAGQDEASSPASDSAQEGGKTPQSLPRKVSAAQRRKNMMPNWPAG